MSMICAPCAFGDACAFGEPACLASGELHRMDVETPPFDAQGRAGVALGKLLACDHL